MSTIDNRHDRTLCGNLFIHLPLSSRFYEISICWPILPASSELAAYQLLSSLHRLQVIE